MKMNEKIKAIRLERREKQLVLAEWLGMTQTYYSQLERGTREIKWNHIERIALYYGIDPVVILQYGNEGVETPSKGDNSLEAITILRNLELKYSRLEKEVISIKSALMKLNK